MNSPKELNDYGDLYFYGNGKTKNLETAFIYYKKAADLNNPVGFFNVSKYFIEKGQFKDAHTYLEKARKLGYTKAMIKLSDLYLEGKGHRRSKKKALSYVQEAVDKQDMGAIHLLGKFYELGIGTRRDEEVARINYQLSADNGNPEAMFYLGRLYLTCRNLKKDYEQGFFWLDKAAVNDHLEAIYYLIELYSKNHPYLKKKSRHYVEEMIFYYEDLLAKNGIEAYLIKVAYTYYEGTEIITINNEKAYTYFKELKSRDVTDGYAGIGLMYLYGKHVEVDYVLAKENLDIAATRNSSIAQNALGEMFRLGLGVGVNDLRAKDYYFEAAKNDDSQALINLGLLNYRNQVPQATPQLAIQYMNQALELDNPLAYYWLGVFYEKGVGCHKDIKKAEENFQKAISHNNQGAKYKYAQMMFDQTQTQKLSTKKVNEKYNQIKQLLFEYIKHPNNNDLNKTYALYLLATLFKMQNFNQKSIKASRYYYELASEKGYAKAKVRMFEILRTTEPTRAYEYLTEAVNDPKDGESLYVLAGLYYEGSEFTEQNEFKAKELYGQAAGLNYLPAKQKLTMI